MNAKGMLMSLPLFFLACLLEGHAAFAIEDEITVMGVLKWTPSETTLNANPSLSNVSQHYVHEVHIKKEVDERYRMTVRLPEDLTAGRLVTISLKETAAPREPDRYVFEGETASASCRALFTWARHASCDLRFTSLPVPTADVQAYVLDKYQGHAFAPLMEQFTGLFATEPVVLLEFVKAQVFLPGALQGNGHWEAAIETEPGVWKNTTLIIDFDRGTYKVDRQAFVLRGLWYERDVAEGGWAKDDDTFGWVRFKFQGSTFSGEWGVYENDQALKRGLWRGSRVVPSEP